MYLLDDQCACDQVLYIEEIGTQSLCVEHCGTNVLIASILYYVNSALVYTWEERASSYVWLEVNSVEDSK